MRWSWPYAVIPAVIEVVDWWRPSRRGVAPQRRPSRGDPRPALLGAWSERHQMVGNRRARLIVTQLHPRAYCAGPGATIVDESSRVVNGAQLVRQRQSWCY